MALFANLVTFPPLAQVTLVAPTREATNFTVVLESSVSLPERPWEVSIWYDRGAWGGTKSPWQALDLKLIDDGPVFLQEENGSSNYRYTFTGELESPYPSLDKVYKGRRVPFTIRYRIGPDSEWSWVYHNFGIKDGELILQPPVDPNFLGASPVELAAGWAAKKTPSECPDARLYTIDSVKPIPVQEGDSAKFHSLILGRVSQTCRWMALVRIWEPWLAPRHGDNKLHLSEPAILVSFLRSDGLTVVLLAINGIDDVLTHLRSTDDGQLVVEARNDSGKDRGFKLLAATAWKFELANSAVMYEARRLVRQSTAYQTSIDRLPGHVKSVSVGSDIVLVDHDKQQNGAETFPTPNWMETWYDSLAYCTWNSLGQDLNAEKIMAGLDSLAANKIHVATLIIDDNWQSVDGVQGETNQFDRAWKAFEANPRGFPEGLKAAITKIRHKHSKLRDVAVWHALLGYWGCISPEGELANTYKTKAVRFRDGTPMQGEKLAIHPDAIHELYENFYSFLSSCGVTAVKTDAQFALDLLDDSSDRRSFTTTYLSAWTQAHLRHLRGKAISCMSQVPQILYHSFLPTNTPRILLRNSDDFFPDVAASHPWHIFCNAHNALFVQHLNVLPDWDMFQSSHPYSGFHAAARCISGGPIYITDTPGEHDVDLIHQMTAPNSRGETVILRPSTVGKTMGVYDKYDEKGVLKIGVYNGRSETGTGMLGVFNIADKEISFILPITKFPGVNPPHPGKPARKWVIRSHVSRRMSRPITPKHDFEPNSLIQSKLPVRGYDVWSALPVHSFAFPASSSSSSLDVAVIGLLGKFTGACAIIDTVFSMPDNGSTLRIHVQLKALGNLGVWLSDAKKRAVDDLMVMMQHLAVPKECVQFENEGVPGDAGVLKIDVQKAWEDMKLGSGWSNEVGLEIFLR